MNERIDRFDRRELFRRAPCAGLRAYAGARLVSTILALTALSVLETTAALASVSKRPYVEPMEVYFPITKEHPRAGHHLSGEFLDFWRRNRNGAVFGWPVSEEIVDYRGIKAQYFDNVRLEQGDDGQVRLGALNQEFFTIYNADPYEMPNSVLERFAIKFPVDFGKPLRIRYSPYQNLEKLLLHTECISLEHKTLVDVMDPTVLAWMKQHKPELLANFTIFWPGQIIPVSVGEIMAIIYGYEKDKVSQGHRAVLYDPKMFDDFKRIDVDLANQTLTAYEGDLTVMQAPVSTGKQGFETPTGKFEIYEKVDVMDYAGYEGTRPYFVPAVPSNLKFFPETYLHGAYWHTEYKVSKGYGVSLGCVNLDPYDAAWLFDWTRLGTPVNIT